VEFVVSKVALGADFLRVLPFLLTIIPPTAFRISVDYLEKKEILTIARIELRNFCLPDNGFKDK
jgi:hypothetical protein